MGKGNSGTNNTTSTSTSEPWRTAQPFLYDVMNNAQQLYDGVVGGWSYRPQPTQAEKDAQTYGSFPWLNPTGGGNAANPVGGAGAVSPWYTGGAPGTTPGAVPAGVSNPNPSYATQGQNLGLLDYTTPGTTTGPSPANPGQQYGIDKSVGPNGSTGYTPPASTTNPTTVDNSGWRYTGQGSGAPSTVAGMTNPTLTGLNTIANQASSNIFNGNPLTAAAEQAAGGLLATDRSGAEFANSVVSGETPLGSDQARAVYSDLASGGTAGNTGLDHLTKTAQGGFLGENNAYLDQTFDRAAAKVTDAAHAANFGPAKGSIYAQNAMTDSLNDLATNIYGGAYENERNRMLSSASALPQYQVNAAGALESAAGTDTATKLGAANTASNINQAANQSAMGGIGLLGDVRTQQTADASDLINVGSMFENQIERELADQYNQWQYPWKALNQYAGIVNGLGGLGGTTTAVGPEQKSNPWMTAGTAASGIGGLLSGLAALSDVRAKDDIRHHHTDDRGVRWYNFRYKTDPPDAERLGVMAQEVPERFVSVDDATGFLKVDYSALSAWGG